MKSAACRKPVTPEIAPDDRLPTFAEVLGFDAKAAWDRLTPAQQRTVGLLAIRLSVVGHRLAFEHNDWSTEQVRSVEVRGDAVMQAFYDGTEALWADFFGWRG